MSEPKTGVGNYAPKSKYATVDEAVKWSVKLLEATLEYARNKEDLHYLFKIEENKKNFKNFAKNLEVRLVKEIDNKIKTNNGILQRLENLIVPENKVYVYGVKLRDAIQKSLAELGLPQVPNYAVFIDSTVTTDLFIGSSGLQEMREHQNVTYNFGQQNKTNNTRNSYIR